MIMLSRCDQKIIVKLLQMETERQTVFSMVFLAKKTDLTYAHVANRLKVLEQLKLIETERGSLSKRIWLIDKGRKVAGLLIQLQKTLES